MYILYPIYFNLPTPLFLFPHRNPWVVVVGVVVGVGAGVGAGVGVGVARGGHQVFHG